ncbi:MAG: hypothetical protein IKV50_04195, partial [Clostridia bacterium]|nr:hypothetical protein [Clostridia bacterium]
MTGEWIMDALDLLDEDMALEVAKLRGKKKKRPDFWRYGMIAAGFCVTLLCVLQLVPLMDRATEDGFAVSGGQEEITLENMGANNSLPDTNTGSISSTVSENEEW